MILTETDCEIGLFCFNKALTIDNIVILTKEESQLEGDIIYLFFCIETKE